MSDQLLVKLENVNFRYPTIGSIWNQPAKDVLHDVSLEIYAGDKLGLIGLNGSGKSTLLQILAGIVSPRDGYVFCRPGISTSLLALGVGFSPDLTGRDNAIMSAVLQGMSEREARKLLPHIEEFSELGGAMNKPVRTYSSGMRSRLAFSAAMHIDVDLILVDEVLAVGDKRFREKARAALLEKLAGDQTVVMVSHSTDQIAGICDKAIWLHQGKIEATGQVDDVLAIFLQACVPDGGGSARESSLNA